jgi:hypothetical protein
LNFVTKASFPPLRVHWMALAVGKVVAEEVMPAM